MGAEGVMAFCAVRDDVVFSQRGDGVVWFAAAEEGEAEENGAGGREEEETSLEKKEETERMRSLVDKDRNRKSEKEPGEISDDSGGRILMEVEEEDIGSEEHMESIVVKTRRYSAVVVKHGEKRSRSDVVDDVLDGPEDIASVPTDGVEELRERGEAAELAPEDMETVCPEGHKSSRSKRSSRKSSRRQRNQEDSSERHERRSGCSKSRDRGQRSRSRDQGNRSRSRESMVVDGSTMTDNLDRKRRSRSRESLDERKGEDKSVDVKKHRSKAKDSAREQTLREEIKLERHRQSRESTHDQKENGQEGSKDPSERNREQSHRDGRAHGEVRGMEERRRSRSKESLMNSKVEDCVRSKWESPSKDFVRDKVRENIRKPADCHDSKRYSSRSNDAPAQGMQNHQQEQEFSRHGGWADKSHVRNHKETCEWMRADSLDKRQQSHSRDSVREWEPRDWSKQRGADSLNKGQLLHSRDSVWEWEHRDGSKQRGRPYEVYERSSSSRYGGHGNESSSRGHNHDRHGCNGSHQDGVQDRSSRANKYLNRDKHVEKDKSHGHDEKCVPRETKRKREEVPRFISAQFKYLCNIPMLCSFCGSS
jgi:hypothetical protein